MKLSRIVSAAMIAAAMSAVALNASVKDLPVRNVNGRNYYYYEVAPKETVYSLCYKLGITKDELIKANPAVADGLKSGMVLFFPVDAEAAEPKSTQGGAIITHHVVKGETIFGLSRKYGVSTDEIIAQNPILTEGLKSGQTLTIRTGNAKESAEAPVAEVSEAVQPSTPAMNGYIVKKKETLYSIARENGISVSELEAANPGLTTLKAGQVINIPSPAPVVETVVSVDTVVAEPETVVTPQQPKEVTVALLLPFMLEEETMSKNAARYTEFYKGFLLAADSLRNNDKMTFKIIAVDTEGSLAKINNFLTSPQAGNVNAIIAPDNADQLDALASWANGRNVKVFNSFIVKNDLYLTNPSVMQSYLPSARMQAKAIAGLVERLRYSTPVFLSQSNTTGDKADFVNDVKNALDLQGIKYVDIAYDNKLTASQLKALPDDGNYTFIPSSGKQAELNKVLPTIIEWRDDAVTPSVRLFGYPEWVTFRGETLENMHKVNTTIYSRFYINEDSWRFRDIDGKYRQWYGKGMETAMPRQGVLGFDTGMFLLPLIGETGNDTYNGVQNGFKFTRADGDNTGQYNDLLYFINFRPGGVIENTTL